MFDTLQDRLSATFRNLRGKGKLTDADIDATAREIRVALLEADVNLAVVKKFIASLKMKAKGQELSKALNPTQQIVKIVNEELISILGGQTRQIRFAKNPPTVIMLAGLQGSGKTTLAGKLAKWLKSNGHSPLLVAADLQRPNAVTQLQVVGQRAGVQVFAPEPGNGIGDPVAVSKASIAEAERKLYDVVIIDTAGRLGVDEEMMAQAAQIKAATSPDETIFVIDAMIGQDAANTAVAFQEGVGFDAVALTKLDGDARGGAALSVAHVTGRPIMFASNGEKLEDFDLFHPDRMSSRILGMGDMLTLIEQAERTFDQEESRKAAQKLIEGRGKFTMQDFLNQMQAVRKMGPLSKVFSMLPGMGQMKDAIAAIDEKDIDRIEAIIYSMTPQERSQVEILNGSRRLRIANGAGVKVSDVNDLVKRFLEARKVMESMAGMMPGMGGNRAAKRQAKKSKKKVKGSSGNPAKRAKQAQQSQESPAQHSAGQANPFGAQANPFGDMGGTGDFNEADMMQALSGMSMKDMQLPPQLQQMLNKQNQPPMR